MKFARTCWAGRGDVGGGREGARRCCGAHQLGWGAAGCVAQGSSGEAGVHAFNDERDNSSELHMCVNVRVRSRDRRQHPPFPLHAAPGSRHFWPIVVQAGQAGGGTESVGCGTTTTTSGVSRIRLSLTRCLGRPRHSAQQRHCLHVQQPTPAHDEPRSHYPTQPATSRHAGQP